jgi:hypothetical protein
VELLMDDWQSPQARLSDVEERMVGVLKHAGLNPAELAAKSADR